MVLRAASWVLCLPIRFLPIETHFGTVLALSLLILAAGFHFLVNDEQARAEEEDVPKFSFRTIDPCSSSWV